MPSQGLLPWQLWAHLWVIRKTQSERGMSKQLKAIEKKLNQAKKEFLMMEKTDKSFVKSLQQNIKNDIKKASINNWYKKIKIS